MSRRFSVAVLTGTRAEYGLLRPVLQKMQASDTLQLQLLVTGAHLSPLFGNTVEEIRRDGIPIAAELPILRHMGEEQELPKTVADALLSFSDWFTKNRPDALLVLGDRYEAFAAAAAASLCQIPVAHISGGDVTEGAADEWYRHSITKMAALHFPSCRDSANRLLRMGEQPETVFCVGGLGDENIRNVPRMTLQQLSENLGFDLTAPFALVTFHPETAPGAPKPLFAMEQLLAAMEQLHAETGLRFLITKSNADAGGSEINRRIDDFLPGRSYAAAFTSLGLVRYLSAMAGAALVLGNSSSGVVETPSFGVPAVNIGNRQKGRLCPPNVLNCPVETGGIVEEVRRALSPEFQLMAHSAVSPYHGKDPSGDILRILSQQLQSGALRRPKRFYDAPCKEEIQ